MATGSTTIIGSSLPPMVEGQLRCFLSIRLGTLKWSIPKPPRDIQVQLIWWGQSGNGAILRPQVDTDPSYIAAKNKHAEIHYPVRCGPRQFESYLKDMNGLHLKIIFGPSCAPFADVNVTGVGNLSSSQILHSYYPLICTTAAYKGKEVGKLKVTMAFKSISDTYNVSSSIIPTTDKEFQPSTNRKTKTLDTDSEMKERNKDKSQYEVKEVEKKKSYTEKQLLTKVPIKNKKRVKVSSLPMNEVIENESEGPSFVVGPGARLHSSNNIKSTPPDSKVDGEDSDEDLAEPFVTKAPVKVSSTGVVKHRNIAGHGTLVLKGEHRATILSSLLDKTQNLRKSMIEHALQSDASKKLETRSPAKNSGAFIKELLGENNTYDALETTNDNIEIDKCIASKEMEKLDMKVVDLLLGKEDNIEQLISRVDMSIDSNCSDFSEDQDPLHDSSLLDQLLYTTKVVQNINESSIISLSESCIEDLNIKEAAENMKFNTKILDDSYDLVPTKEVAAIPPAEVDIEGEELIDDKSNTHSSEISKAIPNECSQAANGELLSESITIQKLTQLGRVKSAKLILKEFSLCVKGLEYGIVYFTEFKFPVSTEDNQNILTENVRHVSRHINHVVEFGRFSVFPILFNEEMVEFWWNKSISFTMFVKYEKQEKPEWLGEGYFKLRDIILNNGFSMNTVVDIYSEACAQLGDHKTYSPIGQLKLYIELTAENGKSVSSKVGKTGIVPSITVPEKINSMCTNQLTPIKINTNISKKKVVESQVDKKVNQPYDVEETSDISLHNLVMVSNGEGIVHSTKGNEGNFCNSYFICRVFWSGGELKSKVCWSTCNPNYGFQQIIPVKLTNDAIKNMENNFMIIEVWHKSTTADRDKLIGLSKLPLHQFFISFKDHHLAETILKSKYPVVANDSPVPVVNLSSGKEYGCLHVLFALGTHDQIMQLIQMKSIYHSRFKDEERKGLSANSRDEEKTSCVGGMAGHEFQITISSVAGLMQDNDEVWGESDCFIQYNFPELIESGDMRMSNVKTTTTLCLPNPVFNFSTSHIFKMEKNVPLQKLLLECFKTNSNDLRFELWKRHYYPNVRDQLIMKANLPLAKLCAMITMHDGNDSRQSFRLPLQTIDVDGNNIGKSSVGMLDIMMRYKRGNDERRTDTPKQLLCLSVSISRLCGLKDGLSVLSRKYKTLTNATRTGPNVYVKIFISFLGQNSTRITNVAAKNYCPTFNFHIDFPVPLTFGGDTTSLAEKLENGFIVCEVMHEFVEIDEEDIMIGYVKIPLSGMLTRATGIKGWRTLKLPNLDIKGCNEDYHAGGIEVNAKFTNNTDREQVINVGRGIGWSPEVDLGLHDESWFSSVAKESDCKCCQISMHLDIVMIPINVIDTLIQKYATKQRFGTMYCRYKFYNKAPIYSKSAKMRLEGETYVISLRHTSSHEIIPNTSFAWYLREEKLEMQFWLSWSNYKAIDASFTRQRDKLVGSIFVDMRSMSLSPYLQKVTSGQYSLFNSNCDSICNGMARVSVAFNTNIFEGELENLPSRQPCGSTDESFNSSNEEEMLNDICAKKDCLDANRIENEEGCEKVNVQVEESMHLSTHPNVYVTYQLPQSPLTYTAISKDNGKHRWNFQKQHRVKIDNLKNTKLAFHVWRCVGKKQNIDADILMGTAELETHPLFVGLKQILGWYNVQDLNRQVVGQIKLGVLPSVIPCSSISTKYFRQPIGLTTSCFPSTITSMLPNKPPLDVPETSQMSLFEKLNTQLIDLQELTSKIQRRVYSTTAHTDHRTHPTHDFSSIVPSVIEKESIPSDEMIYTTEDVCSSTGPNECSENREMLQDKSCNDGNKLNIHTGSDLSEIVTHELSYEQPISSVTNICDVSVGETLIEESPQEVNDLEIVHTNCNLEDFEDQCVDDENIAENSYDENLVFDYSDELLVDLRKFEKKFSVIKDALEKDEDFEQDSWLSDNEIIDSNVCQTEIEDVTDLPLASNAHSESDIINYIETSEITELNGQDPLRTSCESKLTSNTQFITEDIVNEDDRTDQSAINNKVDIDFQINESNLDSVVNINSLKMSTTENGIVSFPDEGDTGSRYLPSPVCSGTNEIVSDCESLGEIVADFQTPNECDMNAAHRYGKESNVIDEAVSSSSCSETKSEDYLRNLEIGMKVQLPNFFMHQDELAESMEALRKASKLRPSPRRSSFNDGSESPAMNSKSEDIRSRNENKQLKGIIRKTLPVEASEMARIANIFSLKSQRD